MLNGRRVGGGADCRWAWLLLRQRALGSVRHLSEQQNTRNIRKKTPRQEESRKQKQKDQRKPVRNVIKSIWLWLLWMDEEHGGADSKGGHGGKGTARRLQCNTRRRRCSFTSISTSSCCCCCWKIIAGLSIRRRCKLKLNTVSAKVQSDTRGFLFMIMKLHFKRNRRLQHSDRWKSVKWEC